MVFSDEVRDPDFDPFNHIPDGFEEHASAYRFANSRLEVDAITASIERELDDKQTLADASGVEAFLATFSAGIADPINLIPVGGTIVRGARTGQNILEGALATGRAGFIGEAIQETALQSSQETRTGVETSTNMAAGTLVAGILGGTAVGVRELVTSQSGRRFDDVLEDVERDMVIDGPDSVGAAASRATTLEQEGVKMNPAVAATLKAVRRQDPLLRTLTSESIESRRLVQDLAETPLVLGKNEIGEATPRSVERLVRNWQAPLYRSLKGLDDEFHAYSTGRVGQRRFGGVVAADVRNRFSDRLTYKQFRIEVGKAMRRGDTHDILEVAQAARMLRREVFDPLKDEAIAVKLLPEDVDPVTAASYLNRVYDLEKLARPEHRNRFLSITEEWLLRRGRDAEARLADATARSARLSDELAALKSSGEASSARSRDIERELANLQSGRARDEMDATIDLLEARDIAEQVLGRIEGTPAGRLPYDVTVPRARRRGPNTPTEAGALQGRAFLIEDELIEEFLESDVELLAKLQVRSVAPDVELTKKFGDLEMTDRIDDIRRDYERKIAASSEDSGRLVRERDKDIRDVMAIRDRIRGTYGLPADPKAWGTRIGRTARQLNYIRLLGGMTPSAIPDLARPVMVHGFSRVFDDALVPMVRNWQAFKLSTQTIRDMGAATDMVMNSRAQSLADVADDFGRFTKLERGLGALADTFGMVSLMAPWNTAAKQIAGAVSQARLVRAIRADVAGKLKGAELEYLRSAGISADDARAIATQLRLHGKEVDGLPLTNAMDWEDADAFTAFQSAMNRDVDRIIVTPGQDVPLAASGGWGEFGRMMFQFKSFAIASTQRMLLTGLQQRDMATLNGLWLSTTLGMVSYAVKQTDANRPLSDDPQTWLKEGVDRSGALGWFFEANNMMEKATRGSVGLSALTGGPPMSRFASRNVVGAILGPTAGAVTAATQATGSAAAAVFGDEDFRATDVHAVRKLLPYQNLIGFRRLLDAAEQGVADTMGAK